MRQLRLSPRGAMAIAPSALGQLFTVNVPESPAPGPVARITVRGPLDQYEAAEGDSYEKIKRRCAEAFADDSRKAVLLDLDSPGGVVSGCFECVRDLRALAAAAGKPFVAYVGASATSAAYALACATDRIVAAPEAIVGSIGVIDCIVDVTEADARDGIRFELITSGARKADSNPHTPITDETRAAAQTIVDALADSFFELVAKSRPALTVESARSLAAGVMTGAQGVAAGLVDATGSLDQLLAMLASGENNEEAAAAAEVETMTKAEMVAALRKMAEGGDEESKKALAAFDKEEAKAEDDKEEAKASDDDKEEAKASDDDKEEAKASEDDEDDEDEKKTAKKAMAAIFELQQFRTQVLKEKETAERTALIASRPDLEPAVAKYLAKQPLASVKDFVAALGPLPAGYKGVSSARAAITAVPTQGDATRTGSRLSPEAKAELDMRMGLVKPAAKMSFDGVRMQFGAKPSEGAK